MSETESRLIEVCRRLSSDDVAALVQIAEFRAQPAALTMNKGAPEVDAPREYASSLANRAVTQVGELLRLGESAALSPAKGIVRRGR